MNYIHTIKSNQRTMVDIQHCQWLVDFLNKNTINKFVEIGVAKGGLLALVAKTNPNVHIYGLDSWEGMPNITKQDNPNHSRYVGKKWSSIEDVYESFNIIEAPTNNLNLIKGFCEQTIPENIDRLFEIDVLRLDVDWYEGTKFCLEQLYNNVNPGGLVIIDDYHWNTGCKSATDNFLKSLDIIPKTFKHIELYNRDNVGPLLFYKK